MNKKIILIIAVVVLVAVIAGVASLFSNNDKPAQQVDNSKTPASSQSQTPNQSETTDNALTITEVHDQIDKKVEDLESNTETEDETKLDKVKIEESKQVIEKAVNEGLEITEVTDVEPGGRIDFDTVDGSAMYDPNDTELRLQDGMTPEEEQEVRDYYDEVLEVDPESPEQTPEEIKTQNQAATDEAASLWGDWHPDVDYSRDEIQGGHTDGWDYSQYR